MNKRTEKLCTLLSGDWYLNKLDELPVFEVELFFHFKHANFTGEITGWYRETFHLKKNCFQSRFLPFRGKISYTPLRLELHFGKYLFSETYLVLTCTKEDLQLIQASSKQVLTFKRMKTDGSNA